MAMQTRVSVHKNGETLLDIAIDTLVMHQMYVSGHTVPMPFTIQVHSPLGDEIRLVTEDDL